MAEYCRECAEAVFGKKIADKHFRGLCKEGETYVELCEGCGHLVELDHEGRLLGGLSSGSEQGVTNGKD